jgi:molecular chaperone HtpG
MKEEQKFIYYACGSTISSVDRLPNTELLKEKGFEILYMTDAPDEFVVKMLGEYDGKQFCSVGAKDLGIDSEEDKKEIEEKAEESKELLEFIKDALDGEVTAVRLSARLKSRAVCLTADGEVSLEMERVFKRIKTGAQMPVLAEKVLEINPDHKLYEKLKGLFETDKEKLKKYASVIFTQALITEGLAPEDTSDFTQNLIDILSE